MKRVVITGIGVVAPGGIGREAFWKTLETGTSACDLAKIDHLEQFRSQMVAAITDRDPLSYGLTQDEVNQWDRHIQFALVAAKEAWIDSRLDFSHLDLSCVGVTAGTAIGSTIRLEQEYLAVSKQATQFDVDPSLATSYLYHAVTPSSLSAKLADKFHARGPVITISTGCTAGVDAIAQAFCVEW